MARFQKRYIKVIMPVIVHSDEPIALIGGGRVTTQDVAWARKHCKILVAADGGADRALELEWVPETIIGDFDSLSTRAQASVSADRLFQISEQDSTDFDKCLRNIEAPLILGLGFTGRRIDHTLAAFSTLSVRAGKRCLLLSEEEVIFLAPPSITLDLPNGCAFSLYPLGRVEGRSEGLVWPIDGIPMQPDGRVGTSNRVDETGRVALAVDAPKMLVIVPRAHADQVLESCLASSSWG
ncbi:thiamine diphosphokinase [Donghicola sp. XS_ASV15]|uniref:thiamine diphosphokinase n=1 Tax=Donghicola sp. XS_ASV15 TaxID=3241295 RepID=UPI0035133475